MNPFKSISNLANAVFFPFKAIFVVGLCAVINAMTSPGHWWVQWVAFGMGIALLVIWARALKTLFSAAVVGGLGYLAYRWWKGRKDGAGTPQNSWTQSSQH